MIEGGNELSLAVVGGDGRVGALSNTWVGFVEKMRLA